MLLSTVALGLFVPIAMWAGWRNVELTSVMLIAGITAIAYAFSRRQAALDAPRDLSPAQLESLRRDLGHVQPQTLELIVPVSDGEASRLAEQISAFLDELRWCIHRVPYVGPSLPSGVQILVHDLSHAPEQARHLVSAFRRIGLAVGDVSENRSIPIALQIVVGPK